MRSQAKADILAFSAFPFEYWRKTWSTKPLERVNKEIKRRADVDDIFPSDAGAARLVSAVLAEQRDDWARQRHYPSHCSMANTRLRRDNEDQSTPELVPFQLTAPRITSKPTTP